MSSVDQLAERIPLRAGPLSLYFDAGDLRSIFWGRREVLRRIYVAVRDRNWGTVPPVLSNLIVDKHEANFTIKYDVENRQDEIDFSWHAVINGETDGSITYIMDGIANTDFWKNRIGFCVLHPAGAAGSVCRVVHVNGAVEEARLPEWICQNQPVPPFYEMTALAHEAAPGLWVELCFDGDIFEMEDQRNWTDASFKTFCTPLCLPYPVRIAAGTRIRQAIRLNLRGAPLAEPASVVGDASILLSAQKQAPVPLPPIGVGAASHSQPLPPAHVSRLQALHLDHLRADLNLNQLRWDDALVRAGDESRSLNLPLHLAVYIDESNLSALKALRARLAQLNLPVAAWLVYPTREVFSGGSQVAQAVELARRHLTSYAPSAPLFSGTNSDFIFLQRSLPPLEQVDGLTFAINPQVHAFDNASIIETLETQGTALGSARRLVGGKPVIVSPVTLKPRWNPYATGPAPETPPGVLPPQVDVRQASLIGAGWTLGSIKYLAEAGAHSLTYYETTGWRGVMETEAGSPELAFPSQPGCVFPLYFILNKVLEFAGGEVLPLQSSANLVVDGILLRRGEQLRLLLANLTPERQKVRLPFDDRLCQWRWLDESNLSSAMNAPEVFLSQPATGLEARQQEIVLMPYAVAWFEG